MRQTYGTRFEDGKGETVDDLDRAVDALAMADDDNEEELLRLAQDVKAALRQRTAPAN